MLKKDPKPKQFNCFHCQKVIIVKYVRASRNYSQKNNWEYWTESAENKGFYICDDCLMKLYQQHKWEFRHLVRSSKKRNLFCQYVRDGIICGKAERIFIINKDNKKEAPNKERGNSKFQEELAGKYIGSVETKLKKLFVEKLLDLSKHLTEAVEEQIIKLWQKATEEEKKMFKEKIQEVFPDSPLLAKL